MSRAPVHAPPGPGSRPSAERPPGSDRRPKRRTTSPTRPEARSAPRSRPAAAEGPGRALHGHGLGRRHPAAVGVDDLGPQLDQHGRDVDADRAGLEAGAAQGGGVGQAVDLLARARSAQQRVEDRADRAGVDRAVGVTAGALVDRAHVEAGRAPDAPQRLAADLVGQRAGAPVVDEHDVDLLRAVAGRHARPGRGVGVHPLTGRGPRQRLEEHVEVAPRRHHLLDADHRDQHLGQRQAHPAVALGLHHDERAGVGDGEVGAADADLGAQELLPQVLPRGRRELAAARRSGRRAPAGRHRPCGSGRSRGSRPGCGGSPAPGCGTAGRRRAGR